MATSKTNKKADFWDSEMLVGYINSTPMQQMSVSICKKNNNKFVSVTKQFRTQANSDYIVRSAIAIPLEHAQEIAVLIETAVKQGQKVGW